MYFVFTINFTILIIIPYIKQSSEETEVIDLENEDLEKELLKKNKLNKKPRISRLLELLEQAKYNKYHINNNEDDKPNLYEKLENELKTAVHCAQLCFRFVDIYKKNLTKLNNETNKIQVLEPIEKEEKNMRFVFS